MKEREQAVEPLADLLAEARAAAFRPIDKHQLYEGEPAYAVAAYIETSGEYDEYLLLTSGDPVDKGYEGSVTLSPMEGKRLVGVINRWLAHVKG